LRPGVEGLSENIRVISILGRFLEHSRIFYFRHGGDEKVLMGSADLMSRNLNRRIEVLFPVEDAEMVRHVREDILESYLCDNFKARVMQPDGAYVHLSPGEKEPIRNVQQQFILHRYLSSTAVED
jgi:polyphosphate kinase